MGSVPVHSSVKVGDGKRNLRSTSMDFSFHPRRRRNPDWICSSHGATPASRRPHPQRTLHKDRKGGDLFLFTHLTVERCPFYLFIYFAWGEKNLRGVRCN